MKLVAISARRRRRLALIREAARPMTVVNARDEADGTRRDRRRRRVLRQDHAAAAWRAAEQLRWVQTATASLEHYMFDALVEHPCRAEQHARPLLRRDRRPCDGLRALLRAEPAPLPRPAAAARHWEPIGGEAGRSDFVAGPAFVSEIDRRHLHLSDCTLGVVGVGNIGAEICRRAAELRHENPRRRPALPRSGRRRARKFGRPNGCSICCARAISW